LKVQSAWRREKWDDNDSGNPQLSGA